MNGQAAAALADLLHADRALLGMYDEAGGRLSTETATILQGAIADHRQHEQTLIEALEDAEMQVVDASEDLENLMAQHARRVHTATEEADVLDALMLAEQVNAMLYEAAERAGLPEELAELIADHHADERLHVSLIEERTPLDRQHAVACMTGGLTDDVNPDDFE